MRMVSPAAILRTISVYTQRMVLSFPGQSVGWCGQASQVASCVSHSAGMEKPRDAGARGGAWSYVEDKFAGSVYLIRVVK